MANLLKNTLVSMTLLALGGAAQAQSAGGASDAPAPASTENTTTTATTAATEAEGVVPIPRFGGDFWKRSYLTGNWGSDWGGSETSGGFRTDLAHMGIQLDVSWTQFVQGVVDGGLGED